MWLSRRTIRILRPLRTVTRVEGMRALVETLINSLPLLADVGLLLFFEFIVFGIVGASHPPPPSSAACTKQVPQPSSMSRESK